MSVAWSPETIIDFLKVSGMSNTICGLTPTGTELLYSTSGHLCMGEAADLLDADLAAYGEPNV